MFRRKGRDLRNAAALAVHKGKFEKALDCYLSLEKFEPTEAEWSRRVAQMHERLGRVPEAVAALERTIEKYRRAGFEAKASAVRALIHRLDPSREADAVPGAQTFPAAVRPEVTSPLAAPPAETSPQTTEPGSRKRRRLAAGTARIPPTAAGVRIAWAYHQEISKSERVTLALSDLDPDEEEAETDSTTGSGGHRRR